MKEEIKNSKKALEYMGKSCVSRKKNTTSRNLIGRITKQNRFMLIYLMVYAYKDGCSFRFARFLIIGLCNSLVNSWFDIISLLKAPPANLFFITMVSDSTRRSSSTKSFIYQSNYKPLKQVHVDIHHILNF